MIKNFQLTVMLLITAIGVGQKMVKEKSENHVVIKGTNIFMIPPTSFQASNNFKGFQNPNDQTSMIMVVEIPGPFAKVTEGFNSEMLTTRGMELKSKNKIKISDYDGLLIELDQAANGLIFSKQILIYGDETSSTVINSIYLKDSIQSGERIKESILSTIVDTKIKSDPRGVLNYSVNEDGSSLKFLSVVGNGMLFNRDLKTPTESFDKATLLIDKSFAKVEISNKKVFCISRLKKYPEDYSVIPSKGINEIVIDGLSGFELYATNNDNKEEEAFQVILFDNSGGYYLFLGTYLADYESAAGDIKKIITSFKRKK